MTGTTRLFGQDGRAKFQRFFRVMLPIFVTQTAIMGMNFCDTVMSGHAGASQLAGTAIGGNIWMPVFTTLNGILLAAMPLAAQLLGAGRREDIGPVIRHGLWLALGLALLCYAAAFLFLEPIVSRLGLAPDVAYVAVHYLAGIGIGIVPFLMNTVLRSLVDTLGGTRLTMLIFLTTLPVNVCLNYIFIYGKLGVPAMGGVGAGVATGLTNWFVFFLFWFVLYRDARYADIRILARPLLPLWNRIAEFLRIGVPLGLSIFVETSIFGAIAFLLAKFGTDAIAGSQAAMSFTSLVYMIPLSVSMSMTILVGIEAGARRWQEAEYYGNVGLAFNWTCALIIPSLIFLGRHEIAALYLEEPSARALCAAFTGYSSLFVMGDAVAAPIQGILRGYKQVRLPFYSAIVAYWVICAPLGLYFDYCLGHGPFSYWQSLDIGLAASALLLFWRLCVLRRRLREGKN
jgi:MATE family multidrug resistance protein